MKVENYRITGTEAEIDALIMAAKLDGCWDAITKDGSIRIMMRTIVVDNPYLRPAWTKLHELATKMGGNSGT